MKCLPECSRVSLEAQAFQNPDGAVEVRVRCRMCGRTEWTNYDACYRRGVPVKELPLKKQWPKYRKKKYRGQLSLFSKKSLTKA